MFNKVDLKKYLFLVSQSILFTFYWATALNRSNLIVPIVIFAILYFLLIKDLLLALIGLFISASIITFLMQFDFTNNFFERSDISTFYFVSLLTLLFVAFILNKTFISSDTAESNNFISFFYSASIILMLQIFHRVNIQNDPEISLKYLIATGEDNATWLSGFAAGFDQNGSYKFSAQANAGGEVLTGYLAQTFRGLLNFGLNNQNLLLNISNVQRMYSIFISLNVLLVVLIVYKVCTQLKLQKFGTLATSFAAGFSVYLTSASIAVYGHLPVLQTSSFIFAAIGLTVFRTRFTKSKSFNPEFFKNLLFILICFAAAQSWYPIAPAVYLFIAILIADFTFKLLRNPDTKIKKISWTSFGTLITLCLVFALINRNLITNRFSEFVYLLHFPGGTMTPSSLNLLIFFTTIIFVMKIRNDENLKIFSLKLPSYLLFALLIFYVLVIAVSITTSPFSTAYAAGKLGIFVILISLPFSILLVAVKLFNSNNSFPLAIAFIVAAWGAFYNLGAPSGPPSSAYNQFGFPFVLNNLIDKKLAYDFSWTSLLISEVSSGDSQRILCFESSQLQFNGENARICSRFVSGIQGFERESIRELWERVNLNSIGVDELKNQLPNDFESNYKIFKTDPNFESSTDPNQIELSILLNE